jgi:hypothetical protein
MKLTKTQLKHIIKEELEGMLTETTDSEKWSTITMGARVPFPEWEMLSGGGRLKRLGTALENSEIRAAFDETYEKIKHIEDIDPKDVYKKGKLIAMSFLGKLRGTI